MVGAVCAWFAVWGFAPPYFFTVPVIPHLFPDGKPLGPRWRRLVQLLLVLAALATIGRMFADVPGDLAPSADNPLGIPGSSEWLRVVVVACVIPLFFVGVPTGVLAIALRMRRAQDRERTQLMWLLLGGLVLLIGAALSLLPGGDVWALPVALAGVPAAIAVGILRYQLFDVELTLNRTVVFILTTAFVVVVYVVLVYGVQAVAAGSGWGVLLVAVTAFVAAAARSRVQRLVDTRLFGHRHNAYAVVADVGRQVAAASQPVDALQRLVDGLRESLRLPYVAFVGSGLSLSSGAPVHGSREVPVEALGNEVGRLHVGLRSRNERWTEQQESAVREVAARAGTLAYAADLVSDVALQPRPDRGGARGGAAPAPRRPARRRGPGAGRDRAAAGLPRASAAPARRPAGRARGAAARRAAGRCRRAAGRRARAAAAGARPARPGRRRTPAGRRSRRAADHGGDR